MEMSTLVQVLWRVLQWCFKPIQCYQEKLSTVDMLPFLLNFWFLKHHFCPLSGSAYLELFSLFFFLFHWCEERRVVGKKKTDGMREKWGGRRTTEAVEGEQCRAAVPVSEFGFQRSRVWKSIFLKLKHEWNVQWRPVDNGAFMLPPASVSRFSCVLLEIFCHFYSGAVGR